MVKNSFIFSKNWGFSVSNRLVSLEKASSILAQIVRISRKFTNVRNPFDWREFELIFLEIICQYPRIASNVI